MDSTDPQGPGKVLFSQEFYAACKRCMKPGRRAGDAERRADLPAGRTHRRHQQFRKLFADGSCYVAAIPTYVGGHMAMGWATDNKKLRQRRSRRIADRYEKAGSFTTKYWTPEVHVAAFALPRFIAELVGRAKAKKK